MAIGSPTVAYAIDLDYYHSPSRELGSYGANGKAIVQTWFGSLFAYQYTHAFFDLRNIHDSRGVDWWQNSTDATIANRQFCLDQNVSYGYEQYVWGLSSSYTQGATYLGEIGALPVGNSSGVTHNGFVNPNVIACAIGMLPTEAGDTLTSMKSDANVWYGDGFDGEYGFIGSFKNSSPRVYADYFVGIDLGSALIMTSNYEDSGLIWNNFMNATTRYGDMRNLLTQLGFRLNTDPNFYMDPNDISAKSQFAYGFIDGTDTAFQLSVDLASVDSGKKYQGREPEDCSW